MTLKKKTISGIFWNATNNLSLTGLTFVVTIILVRILSPQDFGIMSILLMVTEFITKFNEFGLGSAIVQEDNLTQEKLSSLFWFNLSIGLLICYITYSKSYLIAIFFNEDILKSLCKPISFVFIINSLCLVPKALLKKEMRFKEIFIIDFLSFVFYAIVTIVLALKGFGVKALVFGYISRNICQNTLFLLFKKWHPYLIFNFNNIRNLLKFGIYLTFASVIGYFGNNLDFLVIGKFIGTSELGYYSVAIRLISLPMKKIGLVINKTFFPAFSKIKNDKIKIKKQYLKLLDLLGIITFPMMAGMFVIAPEFVTIFYGNKWSPTIILIRILVIRGLFQCFATISGTIVMSMGRSDISLKWTLFTMFNILLSMIIFFKGGLIGIAIAMSLVSIYLFPINMYICGRLINMSVIEVYKSIQNSAIFTGIMFFLLLLFKKIIIINVFELEMHYQLVVTVLLGILLYFVIINFFKKEKKYYLKQIKTIINEIKII